MVIEISTLQQLQDMNNNLAEDYVLIADIDASNTSTWNSGAGFEPIGTPDAPFTGTFDGQEHTITGLTIARPNTVAVGLFGYSEGATIKNVTLASADITVGTDGGILIGFIDSGSNVTNCHVTGTLTNGGGNYDIGGICGGTNGCTVTECTADITLNAEGGGGAGVVIGYCYETEITRCDAKGALADGGRRTGGLAGYPRDCVLKECTADVNITDTVGNLSAAGGLIGYIDGCTVTECHAHGDVDNPSGDKTGGFCGVMCCEPALERCYSTGAVTSPNPDAGGFCGALDSGTWSQCFWDTETSGMSTSAAGYGRTTAEMKDKSYWYGWTLKGWALSSAINNGYPFFATGYIVEISTLQDLQDIDTGAPLTYILTADIDASATSTWNSGAGFEPIGTPDAPFPGTFDGQGHTITGLTIDRQSTENIGLFGYTSKDAHIKNVTLASVDIKGDDVTGGVVGGNNGPIENVHVTGTVYSDGNYGGGIAGQTAENGTITGCTTAGTVTGKSGRGGGIAGLCEAGIYNCESTADVDTSSYYAGGIVGQLETAENAIVAFCTSSGIITSTYDNIGGIVGKAESDTTVRDCSTSATVTSSRNSAGGIVGEAKENTTILRCYSTGNIEASSNDAGGVVATGRGDVTDCKATGTVKAGYKVGGIIGSATNGQVINCYSTADVEATGTSECWAGGGIGQNGGAAVASCYSTGTVTYANSTSTGGFCGKQDAGTIDNCFWDTETSGMSTSNGGTGKTTAEMKDPRTFTAWDMTTWVVLSYLNNGYPELVTVEHSGTYKIEGQVYDGGEPVENAVIYIIDPDTVAIIQVCKSDADGKWAATQLQNKEYLVVSDPFTETGASIYKTATAYPAIQSITND